jgi:DNA-binding Lrp family transcriptional regulator
LKQHNKTAGAKFIKTINEMNEILECYIISGEFDFMLKVIAENMNAYYDFHVNKLSELDNIANVQSVFVMGTVKQTHVMV